MCISLHIQETDFKNVICKNGKWVQTSSANFKAAIWWKFLSKHITFLERERVFFFINNFYTLNFEAKFGNHLDLVCV